MQRVVVTGMGAVSPLGLTVNETWQNCLNGVSGFAPITLFDSSNMGVHHACEVKGFDPEKFMRRPEVRRRDRYEQLACAAAQAAWKQAGVPISEENAERVAVLVTTAIGGLRSMEDSIREMWTHNWRRINPFVIPMMMPNGGAGLISIDIGARGPALAITSACASGSDSIGLAWRMLRSGELDVALAGGSESTICGIGVGAFDRMGAMTRRTDGVPQPFDKERDGLVMGEGAGVLVMETYEHAKARGAEILGEVVGYGATADAFHITAPHEEALGGMGAIRQALRSAQLNPTDVDYISAHGTGTPLNDARETLAVKRALGAHAYETLISSTKSMTGHMMGATGALEAIFCMLAIRDNVAPPTINYHTPDPECDLNYVPNQAQEKVINVAISNSFGFGGHNSVLAFRRFVD